MPAGLVDVPDELVRAAASGGLNGQVGAGEPEAAAVKALEDDGKARECRRSDVGVARVGRGGVTGCHAA